MRGSYPPTHPNSLSSPSLRVSCHVRGPDRLYVVLLGTRGSRFLSPPVGRSVDEPLARDLSRGWEWEERGNLRTVRVVTNSGHSSIFHDLGCPRRVYPRKGPPLVPPLPYTSLHRPCTTRARGPPPGLYPHRGDEESLRRKTPQTYGITLSLDRFRVLWVSCRCPTEATTVHLLCPSSYSRGESRYSGRDPTRRCREFYGVRTGWRGPTTLRTTFSFVPSWCTVTVSSTPEVYCDTQRSRNPVRVRDSTSRVL